MFKALRDAGVDGMPLKMIVREKGKTDPTMTMEVTNVEKRPIPVSMFEIPTGYTKSDSMFGALSLYPDPAKQPGQPPPR